MTLTLPHLIATVYLAAGAAAGAGVVLPAAGLRRLGVGLLASGAGLHAFELLAMHDNPPPLTDLATAVSFTGWVGAGFFVVLVALRPRLSGLVLLVGPMAFLSVFFGALPLPGGSGAGLAPGGAWSHSHVLLASAGLALLGVAGLAGALLLVEDNRLKRKRPLGGDARLPSVEALDRLIALSLSVGFPLLSLGVVTGMLWLRSAQGTLWTGSAHEIWCVVAWAIYVVLVGARFGGGQGARSSAISAVCGFGFLLFAVIGVGMWA